MSTFVSRRLAILLAIPLLMIALGSWALASPVGASPDDDYHMSSIWCGLGERAGLCEPAGVGRMVPRGAAQSECYAYKADVSARCLGAAGESGALVQSVRGNFVDHQYPPVFYAVMGAFASSNVELSVVLMRLFNVLLFVGVTASLYLALPRSLRTPFAVAFVVTAIPLAVFLIGSVNPSSWAILSAGTMWVAVLGYFQTNGGSRIRLAGLAALTAAIGAGARADSTVFNLMALAAAVVLTARRGRDYRRLLLLPLALAVFLVVMFFAGKQGDVVVNGFTGTPKYSGVTLLLRNIVSLPELLSGPFGTWGLGWLDTLMPAAVWCGSLFALFAALFTGLGSRSRRKTFILVAGAMVLVVIPLYLLQRSGATVGAQVQPRYLLPLMIVFVGVCLLDVDRRLVPPTSIQLAAGVAALTIANGVALYIDLKRYAWGLHSHQVALGGAGAWWWALPGIPGPMVVWIGGSAAFAAAVAVLAWHTVPLRHSASGRGALVSRDLTR